MNLFLQGKYKFLNLNHYIPGKVLKFQGMYKNFNNLKNCVIPVFSAASSSSRSFTSSMMIFDKQGLHVLQSAILVFTD